MNIHCLEVYRDGKRVYQGVALGNKDANSQIATIIQNASEQNQVLKATSPTTWQIVERDTGITWGDVKLVPLLRSLQVV